MKNISTLAIAFVTALTLSAAPLASASARDWDHHGGGGGWHHGGGGGWHHGGGWGPGPIAAIVGATAALVTAPFVLAGELAQPASVYAAPPQAYGYAPAPVAYGGYPGYYYARPAPVAYGYPPGYAYPAYAPY